jgi:hypothetical protein
MINNEEEKPLFWRRIASIVYIFVAASILSQIFEYGFSLSPSIAYGLAVFIALLTSYPIRIKGSVNGWSNDKIQWTFLSWSIFSVVISALLFLASYLLLS